MGDVKEAARPQERAGAKAPSCPPGRPEPAEEGGVDEKELNDFIARLDNVADEPNTGKAAKPKPRPYPIAVNPRPSADNTGEGWGGKATAPLKERAASPTSGENLAYLNALTAIRVVFRDGREVVTTVQRVDEVIEEEKESRRRASRRREV